MKITPKAAVLLSLAAFLPAAAQMEINPDHFTEPSASIALVSQQDAQVGALNEKVKEYQEQLRAKFERVEEARQEAISAGIQGDGAQAYIDVYQQEQKEAELLRAALTPQIEQARATIDALSSMDSQASLITENVGFRGAKKKNDLIASDKASNLRATGK